MSHEISMHLSNSSVTSGVNRWDLVNFRRDLQILTQWVKAAILTDILGDENHALSESWKDWSVNKPKLAAILWPAIQQLAIHQAYFAVPNCLSVFGRSIRRRRFKKLSMKCPFKPRSTKRTACRLNRSIPKPWPLFAGEKPLARRRN